MSVDDLTVASATTGTITIPNDKAIFTITPTGACTFIAPAGTPAQVLTIVFTTSGVSSFVMTFGTGFKKVGTLATGTTTAKTFVVRFICIATNSWAEMSRTAAQS